MICIRRSNVLTSVVCITHVTAYTVHVSVFPISRIVLVVVPWTYKIRCTYVYLYSGTDVMISYAVLILSYTINHVLDLRD